MKGNGREEDGEEEGEGREMEERQSAPLVNVIAESPVPISRSVRSRENRQQMQCTAPPSSKARSTHDHDVVQTNDHSSISVNNRTAYLRFNNNTAADTAMNNLATLNESQGTEEQDDSNVHCPLCMSAADTFWPWVACDNCEQW